MTVRKICLDCCLKHLGQALVLMLESQKGYENHRYIAMGHLAEAEDECVGEYSDMAKSIRETRLSFQNNREPYHSIEDLISKLDRIKERDGSRCGLC